MSKRSVSRPRVRKPLSGSQVALSAVLDVKDRVWRDFALEHCLTALGEAWNCEDDDPRIDALAVEFLTVSSECGEQVAADYWHRFCRTNATGTPRTRLTWLITNALRAKLADTDMARRYGRLRRAVRDMKVPELFSVAERTLESMTRIEPAE